MNQVSSKLRRTTYGYAWFCPACNEMHPLPDSWKFNGDLEKPTFTPSFKHEGLAIEKDASGNWTGKWLTQTGEAKSRFGPDDKKVPWCCHYTVTDGRVSYCDDSTHSMRGTIDMPPLPKEYMD